MLTKETKTRITFTLTVVAAALVAGMLTAGCGTIDEVQVNDDASNTKPTQTGTAGNDSNTGGGTGGTMTPAPTTDGSTTKTDTTPTITDGNNAMLTTDQIIAELKVVPPQVVFVIANPSDFGGAKFGYEMWNFPVGKKCLNSNGNNTALIWLNGKWTLSGPSRVGNQIINNPVIVSRIATSDELAVANVSMKNVETPAFSPLTVDLWKVKNQSGIDAAIAKVNGSSPSPLACTDP